MALAGIVGAAAVAVLLPGGAAAAPPEPSATVEPATDLVDGDTVTITVDDAPSSSSVFVLQCPSGAATQDECDGDITASTWLENPGSVTLTLRVATILHPGYGPRQPEAAIDCRESGACHLRVEVFGADDQVVVEELPLQFDPAGDLAPPPDISVTPDEDLDDLEEVTVTGSGFVWSDYAYIRQCVTDPVHIGDCDQSRWDQLVNPSASGDIELQIGALAVIDTEDHGTVDCREPGRCVMSAATGDYLAPGRYATAPISFDPDTEIIQPTLTVTPDSNLADGDTVTVTGSDFDASFFETALSLCPPGASSRWADCRSLNWVELDESGAFSVEVPVLAAFTTPAGDDVDCRTSSEPCVLLAGPGESVASVRSARAELHFDPDAPLLSNPSIEVSPSDNLPEYGEVSVTGTGFLPSTGVILSVCQVGAPSLCDWTTEQWMDVDGSGGFTTELTISSTFTAWGPEDSTLVDCADADGPGCQVVVTDETTGRTATKPITFAPPAPPEDRYLDPVFDEVDVTKDLVYTETTDANGNPVQLQLDIYEPAGDDAELRPAVVWMPGDDTWFAGDDKDGMASYAEAFARRGYVAITMDYRMRPGLNCCSTRDALGVTEAILDGHDDATAGIAWLQDHAADYRIDPEAIAAGGASAGATNSLGLAYLPEEVDHPEKPGIAAALAISGNSYGHPEAEAVPVMAFHGGSDDLAPVSISEWACAAAEKVGARCDVVTYANAWHDIASTRQRDIVTKSASFLADVMLEPRGYIEEPEPSDEPPGSTTTTTDSTTTTEPSSTTATTEPTEPDDEKGSGLLPRTGSDLTMLLLRVGLALAGIGLSLLGLSYLRRRRAAAAVGSVTGLLLAIVAVTGALSSPRPANAAEAGDPNVPETQLTALAQEPEDEADGTGDAGDGSGDPDAPTTDADGDGDTTDDTDPSGTGDDGDDATGDGSDDSGDGGTEHGSDPETTGEGNGDDYPPIYADFPDHWTEEQVAYAQALIDDTEAGLQRFRNPAILPLLGFNWIGDGLSLGEYQHWTNIAWIDGDNLNPEYPESLVFRATDDEPRPELQAAMYMVPYYEEDQIPEDIAWLPGWHVHDNLCFDGGKIVGLADENGHCEQGSLIVTPYMMHVWIVDTPCGRFAGVDENGLMCHEHEH